MAEGTAPRCNDYVPSFVQILANPSYEPVASRVPSLCRIKRYRKFSYSGPFTTWSKVEERGMWTDDRGPTFQSRDVTSLLLGTSWPPSRIQWRSTSWVELELLFSLRFHILAVESPELKRTPTQQVGGS